VREIEFAYVRDTDDTDSDDNDGDDTDSDDTDAAADLTAG
jgi:hypothetical protein